MYKVYAQEFEGNSAKRPLVFHQFVPFLARRVRLVPTAHYDYVALRWEVYGCTGDPIVYTLILYYDIVLMYIWFYHAL